LIGQAVDELLAKIDEGVSNTSRSDPSFSARLTTLV
jgi:hypothetical protein